MIYFQSSSDVFLQNYSLTEFEESNHDDEPLGRTGKYILCNQVNNKKYEK